MLAPGAGPSIGHVNSPLSSVDRHRGGSSSNGTHNAPYDPRHAVEVVDATGVLDLQCLLHEGLEVKERHRPVLQNHI